nr:hypothetical protein [Tanacetum cinerariifolium]
MQGTSLTKQEQERKLQSLFAAGTSGTRANISGIGGNNSCQQRVMKCYNCQGEGHMIRQCPKPKRKRDATWFRDKVLLVKAQGSCKVLNEEELEFLADLEVAEGPVTQTVITHNATFQADDYVQDPLALIVNHQMTPSHFKTYQSSYNNPQFQQQFSPSQPPQYGLIHPTQHYSTTYPSTPHAITYPPASYPNAYSSTKDYGLAVPVFKQGDDIIDAINKMMSFLSTIVISRFPFTNNKLRNSSNPRQQATIHDGRVTV